MVTWGRLCVEDVAVLGGEGRLVSGGFAKAFMDGAERGRVRESRAQGGVEELKSRASGRGRGSRNRTSQGSGRRTRESNAEESESSGLRIGSRLRSAGKLAERRLRL